MWFTVVWCAQESCIGEHPEPILSHKSSRNGRRHSTLFFNLIEICVHVMLCVCVRNVCACVHFSNSIECVTQGQTHTFDFSKCWTQRPVAQMGQRHVRHVSVFYCGSLYVCVGWVWKKLRILRFIFWFYHWHVVTYIYIYTRLLNLLLVLFKKPAIFVKVQTPSSIFTQRKAHSHLHTTDLSSNTSADLVMFEMLRYLFGSCQICLYTCPFFPHPTHLLWKPAVHLVSNIFQILTCAFVTV